MKLFKSQEQNLVHYVTAVTYGRVPLFRDADLCELFIAGGIREVGGQVRRLNG